MKSILTILFILILGVIAQAQDTIALEKVKTTDITVATVKVIKEVKLKDTHKVVRLYKFKNSRIKRELNFITKNSKAKMA